jgi:hypothetical protein
MGAEVNHTSQGISGDELCSTPGLSLVLGATGAHIEQGMAMVAISQIWAAMKEN